MKLHFPLPGVTRSYQWNDLYKETALEAGFSVQAVGRIT